MHTSIPFPVRRFSPALAAGILFGAAVSAPATVVSYYIGVDTLENIASGEFAGVANPNYNRLTLLYAHPNEATPASSHYHSKGVYRYQPGSLASPVVEISPSNYLPEGSNPPLTFTAGSGIYSGKTVVLESVANPFSLIQVQDTGTLSGYTVGSVEHYLFHSSSDRWSGSISGADVHLVLVGLTPGLNIGSASAWDIGLSNPGDEFHLSDQIDFSPVFWMEADAAAGDYVAQFKLVDEDNLFGDSGTFEFRFAAVPEPSSALLLGSAMAFGLIRRRR